MKKYFLLITIILASLIALNGCTVSLMEKDDNVPDEKQVFAQEDASAPVSDSHKYTVETFEGEITAPDGTILTTYSYSYPVFESNGQDNGEYIATINKMFKDNALEYASNSESEYEYLLDEYEYVTANDWSWFGPYDNRYSFEIHLDAKGILSVTETRYSYTGGAHGNARKKSYTFNVTEGRELTLSDLLYGADEEITAAFTSEFLKIKDVFFDDPSKIVPEEFPTAEYYVDADGVTAYFQQYQVGSYASGFVSATISDKEMLKFDFSDTAEN